MRPSGWEQEVRSRARTRADKAEYILGDYDEEEKLERLYDLGYLTSSISFLGFWDAEFWKPNGVKA
jgi:hypothetical protein